MAKTLKATPSRDPARKQAVIYARVSSKEQEKEGFSIPAQLKLLKEYAAAHGFTVAEKYVDVETAKQSGRASFGAMLAYLKARPSVRVLLVEKTDRLYRNLKDWVTVDELDVEIHFPKEGVVISRESRTSEKFMHGIKVLIAKNYIDNRSEEARKGMPGEGRAGYLADRGSLGLSESHGAKWKEDYRARSRSRPTDRPSFRMVRVRHALGARSCEEGSRRGARPPEERCAGHGEHGARDPAQSPLRRRIRVERSPLSGNAPTTRHSGALGASAGRARWPPSQETPPRKAQLWLLRPDRMRPLRLFDRGRD